MWKSSSAVSYFHKVFLPEMCCYFGTYYLLLLINLLCSKVRAMGSQITTGLFVQQFDQASNCENRKAPHYWPQWYVLVKGQQHRKRLHDMTSCSQWNVIIIQCISNSRWNIHHGGSGNVSRISPSRWIFHELSNFRCFPSWVARAVRSLYGSLVAKHPVLRRLLHFTPGCSGIYRYMIKLQGIPGDKVRTRWGATACCGKSKFAISSGGLNKGSVSHLDGIVVIHSYEIPTSVKSSGSHKMEEYVTRMTKWICCNSSGWDTNASLVIRMTYCIGHKSSGWDAATRKVIQIT